MSTVEHHNPPGLHRNPAFSQAVSVRGPHTTVYVGGQNAVDAQGALVGPGDLAAQTRQVFHNLQVALAAAGADLQHVVKWNILVVQGQDIRTAFQVFQDVWGRRPNPPAITVSVVAGLARPDCLTELDAIAVVPG